MFLGCVLTDSFPHPTVRYPRTVRYNTYMTDDETLEFYEFQKDLYKVMQDYGICLKDVEYNESKKKLRESIFVAGLELWRHHK